MYSRRIQPPKLKTPWTIWCKGVLEAVEAKGSWQGSHAEALEAAKPNYPGQL